MEDMRWKEHQSVFQMYDVLNPLRCIPLHILNPLGNCSLSEGIRLCLNKDTPTQNV